MEETIPNQDQPTPHNRPAKHGHRFLWIYALIILLALATGGVYAWQHRKVNDLNKTVGKLNSQIASLQDQTSPTNTIGSASNSAASSSSATKYIEIKEYGVKFVDSGTPQGLSYILDNKDQTPGIVLFGSKQMAQYTLKYDYQKCQEYGALGTLYKSTDPVTTMADEHHSGQVAHIGKYYYVYSHPQNACSTNTKVMAEQQSESKQLITELKTLKEL